VQTALVLTGTDGLSAGLANGLWTDMTPYYASHFPGLMENYQTPAAAMAKLAQDKGIELVIVGTTAQFALDCVSMNALNVGSKAGSRMRVLGVDPAAAGPTGYGIVDSDGRNCQMLHYGALRVPAARQKESSGAALQDIHELMCRLIREFAPTVLAVESVLPR